MSLSLATPCPNNRSKRISLRVSCGLPPTPTGDSATPFTTSTAPSKPQGSLITGLRHGIDPQFVICKFQRPAARTQFVNSQPIPGLKNRVYFPDLKAVSGTLKRGQGPKAEQHRIVPVADYCPATQRKLNRLISAGDISSSNSTSPAAKSVTLPASSYPTSKSRRSSNKASIIISSTPPLAPSQSPSSNTNTTPNPSVPLRNRLKAKSQAKPKVNLQATPTKHTRTKPKSYPTLAQVLPPGVNNPLFKVTSQRPAGDQSLCVPLPFTPKEAAIVKGLIRREQRFNWDLASVLTSIGREISRPDPSVILSPPSPTSSALLPVNNPAASSAPATVVSASAANPPAASSEDYLPSGTDSNWSQCPVFKHTIDDIRVDTTYHQVTRGKETGDQLWISIYGPAPLLAPLKYKRGPPLSFSPVRRHIRRSKSQASSAFRW